MLLSLSLPVVFDHFDMMGFTSVQVSEFSVFNLIESLLLFAIPFIWIKVHLELAFRVELDDLVNIFLVQLVLFSLKRFE